MLAVAQHDHATRVGGDVGFVRDHDDRLAGGREFSNTRMISSDVFESRLPVGSSASRIDGRFTSARAIATR
jgi:hypothetical protein